MNLYYYYGDKEWEESYSAGIGMAMLFGFIALVQYFIGGYIKLIIATLLAVIVLFFVFKKFLKYGFFSILFIGLVSFLFFTYFDSINAAAIYGTTDTYELLVIFYKELVFLFIKIIICLTVFSIIKKIIKYIKSKNNLEKNSKSNVTMIKNKKQQNELE